MQIWNHWFLTTRTKLLYSKLMLTDWRKSTSRTKITCTSLCRKMIQSERILKFKFRSRKQEFRIWRSNWPHSVYNTRNKWQVLPQRWNWLPKPWCERQIRSRSPRFSSIKRRRSSTQWIMLKINKLLTFFKQCTEWRRCMKVSWQYFELKRKNSEIKLRAKKIKLFDSKNSLKVIFKELKRSPDLIQLNRMKKIKSILDSCCKRMRKYKLKISNFKSK